MHEYPLVENFFIFEELNADVMGKTYRASEKKDDKPVKHCLLEELNPILCTPDMWKLVNFMIEGTQHAKIRTLLCPDTVVKSQEKTLLVYPFIRGRNLNNVMIDAAQKETPMDMDLTFALALAVASAIEMGSIIQVNKQKAFHGLLVPENIFIDYDGRVLLKHFGILPFLKKENTLFSQLKNRYKEILAPEFLLRDTLLPQSDVYMLGNIIFKILTGKYFTIQPDEKIEERFRNVTDEFINFVETDDPNFNKNIADFFTRTLNPEPTKRFPGMTEVKEFIAKCFNVSELSTSTFIVAFFMNLLYTKAIESEDEQYKKEMAYRVPVKVEEKVVPETRRLSEQEVEDFLASNAKQKGLKSKLTIIIVACVFVLIGIIVGYVVIGQKNAVDPNTQVNKVTRDLQADINAIKAQVEAEYRKRLEEIEKRVAQTQDEKKVRDEQIAQLKEWKDQQEKSKVAQVTKNAVSVTPVKPTPTQTIAKSPLPQETKTEVKIDTKPQTLPSSSTVATPTPDTVKTTAPVKEEKKEITPALKKGDLLPLDNVSLKPNKMGGRSSAKAIELKFPTNIMKNYSKQTISVKASLLINEYGSVADVKLPDYLSDEMKPALTAFFKTFEYTAAEKDKVKVKVWFPASVTISFD